MSRHRAATARAATPPPAPAAPTDRTDPENLVPRQGLAEQHPSGPLPRAGRRRPGGARTGETDLPAAAGDRSRVDPPTAPLDLAAIALAAASVRQAGLPPTGSSPAATGGVAVPRTAADRSPATGPAPGPASATTTGGTPRPAFPAAVPSALAPPTPSHPVAAVGRRDDGRRRVALPTRTAGALALVGALAGGGVAVAGGGAVLAADRTPTTGEFRAPDVPDVTDAAAVAAVDPAPADTSRARSGGD